jgi:hypothetical protein
MASKSKKAQSAGRSTQSTAPAAAASTASTASTATDQGTAASAKGAAAASPATTKSQPSTDGAQGSQAPQTMKKGIYLSAMLYVEGMQAPADDFSALAKSAVTDALAGDHKGLSISVKNLKAENNVDDSEEGSQKTGGFEF